MQIFVTRRPIFDYRQRIVSYRLPYCAHGEDPLPLSERAYQSQAVASQMLEQLSPGELVQGRKAQVAFPRALLVQRVPMNLPNHQLIVEIPETLEPDGEVVHACQIFRAAGYSVVVDGRAQQPGYEHLHAVADIIKVDFQAAGPGEREARARQFSSSGQKLLAENVHTWADYREAMRLGYDFCQGDFFVQPEIIERARIPVGKLNHIHLLREVNRRDVDLDRLEEVLKQDVGLSVRLLQYVNSVWFGLSHRVYSLRHALVLLGTDTVRRWASLITVTGIAEGKPSELVATALFRASFCERLASLAHLRGREADLFLVGLLSPLDAMTGRPLTELLADVAVSDEVRDTLTAAPTRLTPVYDLVRAYERGNWSAVVVLAEALGLDLARLPQIYRQVLRWVNYVLTT